MSSKPAKPETQEIPEEEDLEAQLRLDPVRQVQDETETDISGVL